MRSEGVGGLYRGLGPQFMALFPNWAVSLHVHTAATLLRSLTGSATQSQQHVPAENLPTDLLNDEVC